MSKEGCCSESMVASRAGPLGIVGWGRQGNGSHICRWVAERDAATRMLSDGSAESGDEFIYNII